MSQKFETPRSRDWSPQPDSSGWDGKDRRGCPSDGAGPKGIKFDATINLGHILTFLGFLLAGFTAWTTLDKRVVVLEARETLQAVIDRNQDSTIASNTGQIKESLLEIKTQINRLADRVDPARRNMP